MSELSTRNLLDYDSQPITKKIYYDTFDWRLYNHKLALLESANCLILWSLSDQMPIYRAKVSSLPIFIWQFPEGALKEHTRSILGPRALLKLFEVNNRLTILRILNNMQKTVARLHYEQVELMKHHRRVSLGSYLSIVPVKGYKRVSSDLADWIIDREFIPSTTDVYHQALNALKRTPGDYSAKPNIQLSPTTPSATAIKSMLRFLLHVILQNEAGIKNDKDTEFLHDFRVAIRRTRSMLSQVKSIFPPKITQDFRRFFGELGKVTNRMRDLDVYLLKKDTFIRMLPECFKLDIEPFFIYLQQERKKEFGKTLQYLNSKKYRQILKKWEKFLNESADYSRTAKNAQKACFELACVTIFKRYRAVMKQGDAIHEMTKDEVFHDLRIECKKLRYLLEFFSSLFPQVEITFLVAQLKKLQNNLGRFQDLCVSEEVIHEFVDILPCNDVNSKRTVMALGSLIDRLDLEKRKVRNGFSIAFEGFSSPKNTARFSKLFSEPVTGKA